MLRVADQLRHQRGHTAGPRAVGIARLGARMAQDSVLCNRRWPIHLPPAHRKQSRTHASSSRRLFTSSPDPPVPLSIHGSRGRPAMVDLCYSEAEA